MCTQVAEALAKRPDAPKCVVAARPELETGAAARLLREWAGDARNVVVLTARPGAPHRALRRTHSRQGATWRSGSCASGSRSTR